MVGLRSCLYFFLVLFFSVVQTLAHNSTATLSVIKDYLINKLQRESLQIEDDERKIRQYREETAHLRSEIQELKTRCRTSPKLGVTGCITLRNGSSESWARFFKQFSLVKSDDMEFPCFDIYDQGLVVPK